MTWFGKMDPEGKVTHVATIPQSAFLGCPFTILVAEHYKQTPAGDWVCKCSEPEERERMKREWEYSDEDFRHAGLIP